MLVDAFPLSLRAATLVVAGVWGWYLNLAGLNAAKIDTGALLKHASPVRLQYQVYPVAGALTVVLAVSTGLFWVMRPPLPDPSVPVETGFAAADIIPLAGLLFIIGLLIFPGQSPGHRRVFSTFLRISIGRIDSDLRLGDILLADGLISYARVFGDMSVIACVVISGKSALGVPDRSCGSLVLTPLITTIPALIRLKQCVVEYRRTGVRTHALNMLKYATSIPVAVLAALNRAGWNVFELWILASFLNTFYSLYWDITYDWGLSLLSNRAHGGLRGVISFPRWTYYAVVLVDIVIRHLWLLRLSSSYGYVTEIEGGMFVLSALEIFRRWLWVFFRVENEWAQTDKRLPLSQGLELETHED